MKRTKEQAKARRQRRKARMKKQVDKFCEFAKLRIGHAINTADRQRTIIEQLYQIAHYDRVTDDFGNQLEVPREI